MSARTETLALMTKLRARGIVADFHAANTLRRAEKVLSRWYEQECGDSDDHTSRSIERDEESGRPFYVVRRHKEPAGKIHRYPIPDRERGAIRRVAETCKRMTTEGTAEPTVSFYVQTDPRGCCLYVGAESLTDSNYSTCGVGCCP